MKRSKTKRAIIKSLFLKTKAGFSLIELLVSIAIIVGITGIFLASYRTANKQAELTRSVSDLSSSYRKALNQTLGLTKFDGDVPAGGWGVHINLNNDKTKYFIFADRNNNGQYDDGEASEISGGETMNTPRKVNIDKISLANNSGSIDPTSSISYLDVIYIPPHPTIIFYTPETSTPSKKFRITMINSENGNTKSVDVNFLGLIDMIN